MTKKDKATLVEGLKRICADVALLASLFEDEEAWHGGPEETGQAGPGGPVGTEEAGPIRMGWIAPSSPAYPALNSAFTASISARCV